METCPTILTLNFYRVNTIGGQVHKNEPSIHFKMPTSLNCQCQTGQLTVQKNKNIFLFFSDKAIKAPSTQMRHQLEDMHKPRMATCISLSKDWGEIGETKAKTLV